MVKMNRHNGIFAKISLILIYVSFYLVQLNVHVGATPRASFFSSDLTSGFCVNHTNANFGKGMHQDSRPVGFRLNKRFHPEHHFIAPDVLQDLVLYSFAIKTVLLNEEQPLKHYSFNSPSLRGPPLVA
jgi:hypothetical protein